MYIMQSLQCIMQNFKYAFKPLQACLMGIVYMDMDYIIMWPINI